MKWLLSLLLLLLTSCCPCPDGYQTFGMHEFMMDSKRIAEGQQAVLEFEGQDPGPIPCSLMEEYQDTIAEEDILDVIIYHPTRADLVAALDNINARMGFKVVNGMIRLPNLPPIVVKGMSIKGAQEAIGKAYREQIQGVQVFVKHKIRLEQKVEVIGAFGPSLIPVNGKTRLYEILTIAKPPPDANYFLSYVMRDEQKLPVDLYRLMSRGDMTQNIVMRGGDRIFIANLKDSKVMVMGEVAAPQPVYLPHGTMSIKEVIALAGGIPFTANSQCIQVIRGNAVCPRIYVLSWNCLLSQPNDCCLLMDGDVVYISEKPITQWNRFIQQLLPTIQGFQIGRNFYLMYDYN